MYQFLHDDRCLATDLLQRKGAISSGQRNESSQILKGIGNCSTNGFISGELAVTFARRNGSGYRHNGLLGCRECSVLKDEPIDVCSGGQRSESVHVSARLEQGQDPYGVRVVKDMQVHGCHGNLLVGAVHVMNGALLVLEDNRRI